MQTQIIQDCDQDEEFISENFVGIVYVGKKNNSVSVKTKIVAKISFAEIAVNDK